MSNVFLQQLEANQQQVGAVVLAGGLARRMGGQDKGLIDVGQRPMAAWVIESVRPQVHDIVINANRNQGTYAELGCEVIADRHAGHVGPLAGLSAAMHHFGRDYVFMCPCDSPFIDASIVERLGSALLDPHAEKLPDIAVAHDGIRLQPVFCLAHAGCLASLDAYLESGERKIDKWYATQNWVEVPCASILDSFRNINTEAERVQAESELLV